jgi:hypothetical protein
MNSVAQTLDSEDDEGGSRSFTPHRTIQSHDQEIRASFEGMGCVCHLCLHARTRWLFRVFSHHDYYHNNTSRESGGGEPHAGQF